MKSTRTTGGIGAATDWADGLGNRKTSLGLRQPNLPMFPDADCSAAKRSSGFTLIELLVVMAIIGILAALIVGLTSVAGDKKVRSRLQAERDELVTAIDAYYQHYGFYPQDNAQDPSRPPLYYELTGTEPPDAVTNSFGIAGIANSDQKNFHPDVRTRNFDAIPGSNPDALILIVPYEGPSGPFNTWNYNSSDPGQNTETYDLWAEVMIGGKLVRIGNWKD